MNTPDTVDVVRPMPPVEIEQLFARSAVRGIRAMFADYGVPISLASFDPAMETMVPELFGRVAFIGSGIEGAIVLGASAGPLDRSRPAVSNEWDWIAELTNQLMGRIKNEMLRAGIQLQQALPTVIAVEELRTVAAGLRPWILSASDGIVGLGIEVDVPAPILPDAGLLNWDVPPEGELLLF